MIERIDLSDRLTFPLRVLCFGELLLQLLDSLTLLTGISQFISDFKGELPTAQTKIPLQRNG